MDKSKPVRLPRNASVADIAEARGLQANPNAARERMKLNQQTVNESLHRPNPTSATAGMTIDYEADDSRIELPVMDIDFYDHNPRTTINPLFEDIKESVRENLIQSPLVVTKKPGASRYMLCAGGNTRLLAIQQLWQETQNSRYQKTSCTFRAWRTESYVLINHLIENEVRGEMTFWDKANGVVQLRKQLELETGKSISLRELESVMRKMGLPANISNLSLWFFATEKLPDIGRHLAFPATKKIQPRFTTYKKLSGRFGRDEQALLEQAVFPAQRNYAARLQAESISFEVNDLLTITDATVAKFLKLSLEQAQRMMAMLEQFPEMTLGELQSAQRQHAAPALEPEARAADSLSSIVNDDGTAVVIASGQPQHAPAKTAPPRPSTTVPGTTPEQKILQAKAELLKRVQKLVVTAEIGNSYYETPEMPFGFYVDFPSDGALDLHDNGTDRSLAWWLLATLSSQRDRESAALMPSISRWRTLLLCEGGADPFDHEMAMQHDLGSKGDLFDFVLLANPLNQTAVLALDVLQSYHEAFRCLLAKQVETQHGAQT